MERAAVRLCPGILFISLNEEHSLSASFILEKKLHGMTHISDISTEEFHAALRLIEFARKKHEIARAEAENIRRAITGFPQVETIPIEGTLTKEKMTIIMGVLAEIIRQPRRLGNIGVNIEVSRALEGARKRILANKLPVLKKMRKPSGGGSTNAPPSNRQHRKIPPNIMRRFNGRRR